MQELPQMVHQSKHLKILKKEFYKDLLSRILPKILLFKEETLLG
jgi:hypothetical protein